MSNRTSAGSLWNEDVRTLLEFVKLDSVDVTVTSPPYFNMKDYNHAEGQIGYGQNFESYKRDVTKVFGDILGVTRSGGSLWVVVDNIWSDGKLVLLPFLMTEWVRSSGWTLQDILVWDKMKSFPRGRGGLGLRRTSEHILVFSKSSEFKHYANRLGDYALSKWWVKWPERYKAGGKMPTDVWPFKIPEQGKWSKWPIFKQQKLHECPFAPELVERILLLTTDEGDLVLDPFAGSGMTLAVAEAMGRGFAGFEINPGYCSNFWSQVLPVVKGWYAEKTASPLLSHADMQDRLVKLRKLKYAKMLTERLSKEIPGFRPVSTFVLDSGDPAKIFVLYEDDKTWLDDFFSPKKLRDKVGEITDKPALKTFGVQAQVQVLATSEFIKSMGETPELQKVWLYKRHHMFEFSLQFEEWARSHADYTWRRKNHLSDSTCPILSNIAIYQKEVDLRAPQSSGGFSN